jgi:hypothetical protein
LPFWFASAAPYNRIRVFGPHPLDLSESGAELLPGMPKIVAILHVQEKIGHRTGQLAKQECHIGRDPAFPVQNRIESRARNAHLARRFGNRNSDMLLDNLAHQLTGVSWSNLKGSLNLILSHFFVSQQRASSPSVILL